MVSGLLPGLKLWGLVPAYWAWVYQQQSVENEVPTNQPNTVRNC